MSASERLTITVTAEMAASIRASVAAGDYASDSEIVREALHDWSRKRMQQQQELEQLRAELEHGAADIEAGRVSDFDPEEIIAMGERRLRSAGNSE